MGGQVQIWQVVGGEGKGGLLVRQGKDISSPKEEERLSTGACVREVALEDGRLHYDLVTGAGPQSGWVSIKISGKDLLVKCKEKAKEGAGPSAASHLAAPRALKPHKEVAAKFAACGHLEVFKPQPSMKKIKESCKQKLPGNLYGLPLPATPEELDTENFGAKWLTEAFRKAGTLPITNSIKRIVDWARTDANNLGPEVLFHVEYAKPDEKLDTALLGKFPFGLEENPQAKVQQGQGVFGDCWGGEINFYRFVSPHVPFPVPKMYFGDLNRETHEAVVITAAVQWPEEGKTDSDPYEVMPRCIHCDDHLLKDPQEYYYALMRRQGTLAGLGKTGTLGPDEGKVRWYNYNSRFDAFCAGALPGHEKSVRKLIDEDAPHIFPEVVRDAAFLDRFETQMAEICKAQPEIAQYIYADSAYTGFQHPNGNTHSAYFYRCPDGGLDCGLLDWGSFAHMAFASAFQGSFIGSLGEMLSTQDDHLVCTWADAYHATGAPPLDVKELLLQFRMVSAVSIYCCMAGARSLVSAPMKPLWESVQAYTDEPIHRDPRLKSNISMLYNKILLWALRGDVYWASYQEWVNRGKLGPAKAAEAAAAAEEHARLLKLSVRELKEQLAEVGLSAAGATEKADLVRLVVRGRAHKSISTSMFVPTESWQEVPAGSSVPTGTEIKFDLAKGCNYARLPPGRRKA